MISVMQENADRITECTHKNGIYCILQNVTEFANTWMNLGKNSWTYNRK